MGKLSLYTAFFLCLFAFFSVSEARSEDKMFVQNFQAGEWRAEEGGAVLVLSGISPRTLVFQDEETADFPITAIEVGAFVSDFLTPEHIADHGDQFRFALDLFDEEGGIYALSLTHLAHDEEREELHISAYILEDPERLPSRLSHRPLETDLPAAFSRGGLFVELLGPEE